MSESRLVSCSFRMHFAVVLALFILTKPLASLTIVLDLG